MTPTHTLLIVIPLHVENAQPGRIEAHRPEGIGGLRELAPALEYTLRELMSRVAPDVIITGIAAHAVEGDGRLLAAVVEAVTKTAGTL